MHEPPEYDLDQAPAQGGRPGSYRRESRAGDQRGRDWDSRAAYRQASDDYHQAGQTRQMYRRSPDDHYERPAPPARRSQPVRPKRRLGSLAPGAGVGLILGTVLLGSAVTIAIGQPPGLVLGCSLIAGTTVAALVVEGRRASLLIPVPALAYVVAAAAAGMAHDRALDTSRTALAVNAADWVASGFVAMTAATLIAILIFAARHFAAARTARRPGRRRIPVGSCPLK